MSAPNDQRIDASVKWVTEATPEREKLAFMGGFYAAETALRAQLTASEASRKELREALAIARDHLPMRRLYMTHRNDAAAIDAALANDAEQKGGTVCTCNTGPHLAHCDMFLADQPKGGEAKG